MSDGTTGLPDLAPAADLATLTGKSASDGKLLLALRRASARFRGAVGHDITRVDGDVVILDGDGGAALLLPAFPVRDVTVRIDGVAVTDFRTSPRNGVLRRDAGWPDQLGNVEVTFTHGWATVPGDIEDAVLEQAEAQLVAITGVQTIQQGARSLTFGAAATVGVTQKWTDTVEKYRLRGDRA